MIYLFLDKQSPAQLQNSLEKWKGLEVEILLGPNADAILETCAGLESFDYLFSLESNLFPRLFDLRFDIEPESLIVSDLSMDIARLFRFYEKILQEPQKTDFYRMLHFDRLDQGFYLTKLGYYRLWSFSSACNLNEAQFRWVNIDPDLGLNLSKTDPKNLSKAK